MNNQIICLFFYLSSTWKLSLFWKGEVPLGICLSFTHQLSLAPTHCFLVVKFKTAFLELHLQNQIYSCANSVLKLSIFASLKGLFCFSVLCLWKNVHLIILVAAKKDLLLVVRPGPYPLPLLSGRATKKRTFFAASHINTIVYLTIH